ncbi:hypothetical protein HETIRDRAFT_450347 [Heterobasidion irregulare TC 32-1]|uniref:Uncharacterized protein n=1 Tax=Heterobasidion irregulare (strain TC 32-1) TaxID=747525 RepID=W4K9I0_HETIT|nr:uncharacterized protein HETIRDRAFT_108763 [Heterobasidion irregulare TC 32-1]XP_009544851.1 uncharacterized protein HETIRDRAFT_450347 [Heterobasidion irregulare TC 32-1]ETW82431.1 hypothetical protein HETIRDRAFT_108763 [Heterobasidion irregulare TC 32-1]ETW82492.1 hypothetical protein HETIRDRAFT_450347 [Heterobasidion irregulare TC 32-1]
MCPPSSPAHAHRPCAHRQPPTPTHAVQSYPSTPAPVPRTHTLHLHAASVPAHIRPHSTHRLLARPYLLSVRMYAAHALCRSLTRPLTPPPPMSVHRHRPPIFIRACTPRTLTLTLTPRILLPLLPVHARTLVSSIPTSAHLPHSRRTGPAHTHPHCLL